MSTKISSKSDSKKVSSKKASGILKVTSKIKAGAALKPCLTCGILGIIVRA